MSQCPSQKDKGGGLLYCVRERGHGGGHEDCYGRGDGDWYLDTERVDHADTKDEVDALRARVAELEAALDEADIEVHVKQLFVLAEQRNVWVDRADALEAKLQQLVAAESIGHRNHDIAACSLCIALDAARAVLAAKPSPLDAKAGEAEGPPCGGSRCHRSEIDGEWIHSSKSYGTCSVRRERKLPPVETGPLPHLAEALADVPSRPEQKPCATCGGKVGWFSFGKWVPCPDCVKGGR